MTMEKLPTEILSRILYDLSPIDRIRSEQVCKKWRDISRQTWKDIRTLYIINPYDDSHEFNFENCTELIKIKDNRLFIASDSRKIIRSLVSRVGCFIEKLTIEYITDYHREIFSIVSYYCQNLKFLSLYGDSTEDIDEELLSMLFDGNQELHSVQSRYVDNFIEALPFRNWKSLCFLPIKKGNEEKIISLIKHSEALEEFETNMITVRIEEALLNLRNFKSLYYNHFGLSPETIFRVPLLNRLRDLKFGIDDNCSLNLLCSMLRQCSQLESLSISYYGSEEFPFIVLHTILAHPILETLQIGCHGMTDDMLIELTKFRSLSLCNKSDITNEGILEMVKKSEFLENLEFKSMGYVMPELFNDLVREMRNRQKYLNVRVASDIFDEVYQICAGSKIRLVKYMQCFDHWSY